MEKSNSLKVVWWSPEKVKPYSSNPRRIPHQAIDKIAASLERFGWRQPIVVDKGGVVVVGHTRLLAAIALGYEKVPVHVVSDLTSEEAKAYRIADNRTGEETGWDLDLLADELQKFEDDFEFTPLGFDDAELAGLLGNAPEVAEVVDETDIASSRLDQTNDETECPSCHHRWRA